jgi:hypothetical protein
MFKETQQRKIDLEEDDLSMVELLVKFFYTFDYDNTPANTEMSALGLHASVYTIADKYEVLALKSTALARFKEVLVEFYDVGEVMVEATRDLTGFLPPPTCDTTLHDLVVEAWIIGGEVLSQDIGEEEVLSLFTEMTWLSTAFATRMLARSKSGRICGHRNDLITQAECLDTREKVVLHLRYNLQRGFLPQNGSAKEEEMSALDKILGQLESHGDLELLSSGVQRSIESSSPSRSSPLSPRTRSLDSRGAVQSSLGSTTSAWRTTAASLHNRL